MRAVSSETALSITATCDCITPGDPFCCCEVHVDKDIFLIKRKGVPVCDVLLLDPIVCFIIKKHCGVRARCAALGDHQCRVDDRRSFVLQRRVLHRERNLGYPQPPGCPELSKIVLIVMSVFTVWGLYEGSIRAADVLLVGPRPEAFWPHDRLCCECDRAALCVRPAGDALSCSHG